MKALSALGAVLLVLDFEPAASRAATPPEPEAVALSRTIYVNATIGSDTNDCLAADRACRAIQRGANVVRGGDQMIVGPGTYYETPVFQNLGSSASSPVWIRAEPRGSARISGMWKEAALGQVTWRDDGGGVYSAAHGPVLWGNYAGTYLFRFLTVTDLRNARAGTVNVVPYGLAVESGRVYIRLPGNANPNGKSVRLSPPSWGETGAVDLVRVVGSPYVILDGFVIEGSGTFCATFSQDSRAPTIRNTVLEYCRYGLQLPDDSLVEWSEYVYPGWHDWSEAVRQLNGGVVKTFDLVKVYHTNLWLSGGLADTFSGGASVNGEFRYNYFHEAFDGEDLGNFEFSESHHNVYQYNYDNHIELESWRGYGARELRLHDNLFLAANKGPISHQDAVVGPQYVYRNVVYGYDQHGWQSWTIIKSKAPNATGGIYYYHNVLWGGTTELFWQEESRAHLHFRNNILIFARNRNSETSTVLDSNYNLLVNDVDKVWLRGAQGAYLGSDPAAVRFLDVANLNFGIASNSPAKDRGIVLLGFNDGAPGGPDIGAFEVGTNPGSEWPRPTRTVFTATTPERWNGPPGDVDTTPPADVQNLRRTDTQD